ncbi:hypothetical protein SAMN05192551_11346 [Tindallia magadiensis]|uniref:DUF401 family protein n=1 Tax=Tindallia magadiensis TaxID=69895 RepID=A0A1I3HJK9_9FIRM|nr:DUF401 family protein [Tindallia magadiensis]SFI35690.1 hypothetical protein SAMN05192551_11346 [Tindallia magadiensis]
MELLKLGLVFVVILLLIKKKINLGVSMIIGSVLLAFLFKMSVGETIETFFRTMVSTSTIQTAVALMLIMMLEYIMRQKNMLEKMVLSLNHLIRDYRMVMPVPPMFMGLLPSAGGALFSASMVSNACGDHEMTAERKGVINFWFRHVWECVLPLYPSLIIASEVMGVPMNQFIQKTYPFAIMAVVLGIPYLVYEMKKETRQAVNLIEQTDTVEIRNKNQDIKDLVLGIFPILTILAAFFLLNLSLWFSLFLVILPMFFSMNLPIKEIPRFLQASVSYKIILILIGIMIFKDILEVSGAVNVLVDQMVGWGISIVTLSILLPFAIGFFTGISQAFVAIAFPILIGMMPEVNLSLMALAHVSGFAGIMVSPMHLCLVLTADFFNAQMGKMIAMILPALLIMIGAGWMLVQL